MTVAGWQSGMPQDERRFKHALILSLLLHVLVLAYTKPSMDIARRGDTALTVTLTTSAETATPEAIDKSDPDAQDVIALPASPNTPPKQTVKLSAKPERSAQSSAEQAAAKSGLAMSRGQSKVQALLVIDSLGNVTQIHWKQLPAMTDDELKKIEQRLRQKIYLSNGFQYTVVEELD